MGFPRRSGRTTPGGFFHLESSDRQSKVYGYGEGDYIRLRDEYGCIWRGQAETLSDETIRFSFTDEQGRRISGMSDQNGIILRDEKGRTWRGFVD